MKEDKIIKFLNNRLSPKERKEVMEWLDHPGAGQKLEEMLLNRWERVHMGNSLNEAQYLQVLKKIHHATIGGDKSKKSGIINRKFAEMGKMAALFLLLFFSALTIYQAWKSVNPSNLAEKVPLQKIERSTTAGEKLKITLPDQSKVTLNSLSTIIFDSNFGKTNRLIQLDGEAYFEITSDPEKPFKVQTGRVVTTALGTEFNAFSRNERIMIALTEGKVNVSHRKEILELGQGEMAELKDKCKVTLRKGRFDVEKITAWKEGKIQFRSKPFGEILIILEEWYGVTIVSYQLDKKRKITGIFNNENLKDILAGLSFALALEYNIHGKNVTIKPQPPMQ